MQIIPVFFQERSGSTIVDQLLDQHPNINSYWEIFHHLRVKNKNIKLPIGDFLRKNWVKTKQIDENVKHAMFQYSYMDIAIFSKNLDYDYFFKIHSKLQKNIIYIDRKNILKRIISRERASINGVWHINHLNEIKKRENKIFLDIKNVNNLRIINAQRHAVPIFNNLQNISLYDFLKIFNSFESDIEKSIDLNFRNILKLNYEDHIEENPIIAVDMITDWLGLDQFKNYNITLQKTSNKPLKDLVINYEELERSLLNTEFEWMLY
jgi:LPS sulfotransferase NodH